MNSSCRRPSNNGIRRFIGETYIKKKKPINDSLVDNKDIYVRIAQTINTTKKAKLKLYTIINKQTNLIYHGKYIFITYLGKKN